MQDLELNQIMSKLLEHFRRYYNHFGKYMGHTPITRSPKRIQIRSALNQAEERFTQEFLPNSQQTGKLSLLIRPFLFTIGVRYC